MRELKLPNQISGKDSHEILRAWIVSGQNWVVLDPDVFDDPFMWGLLLVDLAKHAAKAYSQSHHQIYERVLERVKEGFDAEWQNPTDEPRGEVEEQ